MYAVWYRFFDGRDWKGSESDGRETEDIRISEQLQGHFRVSRKFVQRLDSQLQSNDRREVGNRKPTGAEFASGKATSDYFIWLAARRAVFCPYMDEPTRISPCYSFPSPHPHLISYFSRLVPSYYFVSSELRSSFLSSLFCFRSPMLVSHGITHRQSRRKRIVFSRTMREGLLHFSGIPFLHSDSQDRKENGLIRIFLISCADKALLVRFEWRMVDGFLI